jgi:hypothetical protein
MFGDFTAAVAQKLAAGSKAVNLSTTGDYDATTGDFTARLTSQRAVCCSRFARRRIASTSGREERYCDGLCEPQ